jgi:hypothetical protein
MPDTTGPEAFDHPTLTAEENRLQRGGDPRWPMGVPPDDEFHGGHGFHRPRRTANTVVTTPAAPIYRSDELRRNRLAESLPPLLRSRPRQDLLLPYLLIRSFPGDHGRRPFPNGSTIDPNGYTLGYKSPDVQAVAGDVTTADWGTLPPAAGSEHVEPGSPYSVFVRIWNLGLLEAVGITLSVYAIGHGDDDRDRQPTIWAPQALVGQAFLDLPDCHNPECRTVVKVNSLWIPAAPPPPSHDHLISWALTARVSCFADIPADLPDDASMTALTDRHYGTHVYESA